MSEARAAAVGAVDFKGWFIVVWLTSGAVEWPQRCACCLRRPNLRHEIEDDGGTFGYHPICQLCLRHAKADDKAMGIAMASAAILVIGGWIALFGLSIMVHIGVQLVLMLLAFALLTAGIHWVQGLFSGAKGSSCADAGWPVETYKPVGFGSVLGKEAERTDEKSLRLWCAESAAQLESGAYALQLRNREYAKELIRANRGDPKNIGIIQEAD